MDESTMAMMTTVVSILNAIVAVVALMLSVIFSEENITRKTRAVFVFASFLLALHGAELLGEHPEQPFACLAWVVFISWSIIWVIQLWRLFFPTEVD